MQEKSKVKLEELEFLPPSSEDISKAAHEAGLSISSTKRSPQKQQQLIKQGKTKATQSLHLSNSAIDVTGPTEKRKKFLSDMKTKYGKDIVESLDEGNHSHIGWKGGKTEKVKLSDLQFTDALSTVAKPKAKVNYPQLDSQIDSLLKKRKELIAKGFKTEDLDPIDREASNLLQIKQKLQSGMAVEGIENIEKSKQGGRQSEAKLREEAASKELSGGYGTVALATKGLEKVSKVLESPILRPLTRTIGAASTATAGLQHLAGAVISLSSRSPEDHKLAHETIHEYTKNYGTDFLGAVWNKFRHGKETPGYEQPVAELYGLLIEKAGGDRHAAENQLVETLLALEADPVMKIPLHPVKSIKALSKTIKAGEGLVKGIKEGAKAGIGVKSIPKGTIERVQKQVREHIDVKEQFLKGVKEHQSNVEEYQKSYKELQDHVHEAELAGTQDELKNDPKFLELQQKMLKPSTDYRFEETELGKKNKTNLEQAQTGMPLEVTGFRQERGAPVAGKGYFYATNPKGAESYIGESSQEKSIESQIQQLSNYQEQIYDNGDYTTYAEIESKISELQKTLDTLDNLTTRSYPGGLPETLTIRKLKFNNPLVIPKGESISFGTPKETLARYFPKLTDVELEALSRASNYAEWDQLKAEAARAHGYDAIVKHYTGEIQDLRGHVGVPSEARANLSISIENLSTKMNKLASEIRANGGDSVTIVEHSEYQKLQKEYNDLGKLQQQDYSMDKAPEKFLEKPYASPEVVEQQLGPKKLSKSTAVSEGKGPGAMSTSEPITPSQKRLTLEPKPKGEFEYISPTRWQSIKAGIADTFRTNFNKLKAVSERGFATVLRDASSSAITKAMLRVHPLIEKTTGMKIDDFYKVLVEGSLRGKEQRFKQLSTEVYSMSPEDLTKGLENGQLKHILEAIGSTHHFQLDLVEQANTALTNGGEAALRRYLHDTFDLAATKVGEMNLPKTLEEYTTDPTFNEGLRLYKEHIESPLNEAHGTNEGWMGTAKGPLDTYFPLIALTEAGELRGTKALLKKGEYKPPKNPDNWFATGLARDYSTQIEDFAHRLERSLKANNRAATLDVLKDEGLLHNDDGSFTNAELKELGLVRKSAGQSRTIIQDGRVITLPEKMVIVPEYLAKELTPLFDPTHGTISGMAKFISDKIVNTTIRGIAEPAFHGQKIVRDLATIMPFVGKDIIGKSIGNLPILKYFISVIRLVSENVWDEAALRDIEEMTNAGAWSERVGTVTYSPEYARQTGARLVGPKAELFKPFDAVEGEGTTKGLLRKAGETTGRVFTKLSLEPTLFGPAGMDARARLIAYRILKQIESNPTPIQINEFVNQLGTYNRALESSLGRFSKTTGLGTFYSAGSSRLANGLNSWLQRSKIPEGHPGYRIQQALTGGAIGTVALWAGTYKAYTGKWPWEDKQHIRLLSIPIKPEDRQSKVGQMLWGKGSGTAYVGMDWANHVAGGARALGLSSFLETKARGGTYGQATEQAYAQSLSTMAQPAFAGPPTRMLTRTFFGVEPYITSFRDERGKFRPQFYSDIPTSDPGIKQFITNSGEALLDMNFLIEQAGEATGLKHEKVKTSTEGKALKMILDLSASGMIKALSHPEAKSRMLKKQALNIKKTRLLEKKK